jgi:uncharacterized protein YbjQ (UPF0145 family)
MNILVPVVICCVAIILFVEVSKRLHFWFLNKRELKFKNYTTPFNPKDSWYVDKKVIDAELVTGEIIVTTSFVQYYLDVIIFLLFGKILSLEESYDFARREAVLKMANSAKLMNADVVVNVRYSVINTSVGSILDPPQIAVIVSGTAVKFAK